jgi:hypothetical protein
MFINPFDVLEIFVIVISGALLARLARLRGGKGWPWVIVMVPGYFYSRGVGLVLFGHGPDLLVGLGFIALMFGVVFLVVGRGRRLQDSWQCSVCKFYNEPTTLVCPCGYRVDT